MNHHTLPIKIADTHDIILMKCATDRIKDKDDTQEIMNRTKIESKYPLNSFKKFIKIS